MPYSCQSPSSDTPNATSPRETKGVSSTGAATSFGWFVLSGGICFGVGNSLLYISTSLMHIHYLVSLLGCSLLSCALSFSLNRRFAFRDSATRFWRELGRYYVVNIGSIALNMMLMALCVSGLGIPYMMASIGISIGMLGLNFVLHRSWSFGKR